MRVTALLHYVDVMLRDENVSQRLHYKKVSFKTRADDGLPARHAEGREPPRHTCRDEPGASLQHGGGSRERTAGPKPV